MSKNTGTSELINYFDLGVNGDVGISGSLTLDTIANAVIDTDKFLVSDNGIIKYRTGAELLSDIGVAGNYVTIDTAQTITGIKTFSGTNLQLESSGSADATILRNTSGVTGSTSNSNTIGFNGVNNIFVSTQNRGGFILGFNNSVQNREYTLPDASGTIALTSSIPANPVGGTGTTNYLPKFTGASTIGNSLLYDNGTNVYLGNVDGGNKALVVNGTGATVATIYFDSTAKTYGLYQTGTQSNFLTGNLLVGTITDNGARLQVSGSGSFINSSTFQSVFSGWSTTGANTASGAISLGNNAAYRGVISYAADGNTTFSLDNSYDSASAIMRFRMRTAGTAINALTLFGTGSATFTFDNNSSGVVYSRNVSGTVYELGSVKNSGSDILYQGTGNVFINADSNSDSTAADRNVIFGNRGVEYMRIDSSGNVGIGTTSPIFGAFSKLTVGNSSSDGGIVIQSSSTGISRLFFAKDDTSDIEGLIRYPHSTNQMQFWTAATQQMTITSSGNVLIGTTTDNGARLQVSGDSTFSGKGTFNDLVTTTSVYKIVQASVARGGLYTYNQVTGSGTDYSIGLFSETEAFIVTGGTTTKRLTIDSTGAATFSSSVECRKLYVSPGGGAGSGSDGIANIQTASTTLGETSELGLLIKNNGTSGYYSQIGFGYAESKVGAVIAGLITNGGGATSSALVFGTRSTTVGSDAPTERMRITSGGFLKASNTGGYIAAQSFHELRTGDNARALLITNASTTLSQENGLDIIFSNASPNNATSKFIVCEDSSAFRFIVYSNGNVANYNNSYGSISDIKLKENIEDATPKLDDLMKVKVRNYNLIGDDKKQIGVIAQELEEVFPAMIDESEDFEEMEVPKLDEEGNEILNEEGEVVTEKQRVSKGTTTKSVKYSVFVPMLIKAIQEQQEQIQELKNKLS